MERRDPSEGEQHPARHENEPDTVPDTAPDTVDEPTETDASTAPTHPVPAPGEPAGDMWPGVQAVRGEADTDDEELAEVDGIALAPPGKPDGEADTRP